MLIEGMSKMDRDAISKLWKIPLVISQNGHVFPQDTQNKVSTARCSLRKSQDLQEVGPPYNSSVSVSTSSYKRTLMYQITSLTKETKVCPKAAGEARSGEITER